ncbi:MAG: hypothetical protein S4CHLAM7_07950 [Chlamydiae bacterium]|nr:hypothetical protein [Chlamydiota bacterium]
MRVQSVNSHPSIDNPTLKETYAKPQRFAYHDLLMRESQYSKKEIDHFLQFSKGNASLNLSLALDILEKKSVVRSEDHDLLDYSPEEIKPIRHIFDSEGRVVQVISSDGTLDYKTTYDENITTVINQITGEVHVQEMDGQGHLTREVFPCGLEISWKFDNEFLSEVTLPDQSKVVYQCTDKNHINIQRLNPSGKVQYQHVYKVENDNCINESLIGKVGSLQRQYNEASKTLTTKSDSLCVIDQYDEDRNLISRTFKDPSVKDESTTLNYPIGNLLIGENRVLDDQGKVIHYNGFTCSYDEKGHLIEKISANQTTSYGYDAFDRLLSVEMGNKKIEYTYDLSGRRLSKTVIEDGEARKEFYLYQGVNQIGVYNENKEPLHLRALGAHFHSHLPFAIAIESQGKVYAPIYSSNFNIFQLIDQDSKEVIHYESLSPFGENLQELIFICPWIFATKYYDADTGLVDFGDRQYDPSIKQWTSADPDSRATGNEIYSYCNNNPMKFIDPNGNFFFVIPLTQGLCAAAAAILTGIGAFAAKKGIDRLNKENDKIKTENQHKYPHYEGPYPGNDPTVPPTSDYEWKGNDVPGSGQGSWVNGERPDHEILYPDLDHPVHGPHWDYFGPSCPGGMRIYPSGQWEYKND